MRRIALFALLVLLFAAGAGAAQARQAGVTLNLVAYSTPKPVLQQLIANFQQTPSGQGVSFTQSYGSSGSQARAIAAGQPADVAFLSTGLDINTLVSAGLVQQNWAHLPYGGIGADTVVAFAVRPGNPKHIHTWADLTKLGVQVVTPDPFPSGSAKWNVLAAYGTERKLGKTEKQATAFVQKLFHNVVSQDSSASNAMSTFLAGQGDVLITYESEIYAAQAAGQSLQIIEPKQTMLVELPMVALKSAPPQAAQFIAYCHTTAAQKLFAEGGYWPVKRAVLELKALRKYHKRYTVGSRVLLRISDKLFGGWLKANKVWFDPNTGRMIAIEQAVGGPTH